MNQTAPEKLKEFETEICGRCGGCGRYSYNQMDGDKCFGCHGKGKVFTKRGAAAYRWLVAKRTVAVSEIVPGDYICTYGSKFVVDNISQAYLPIARRETGFGYSETNGIRTYSKAPITIKPRDGSKALGLQCAPNHTVERLGKTVAERNAMLLEAFAYQATLTEAGKPKKGSK